MRRLLALILLVWEPLNLALFFSSRLLSIAFSGWTAATLLGARLLIAGIGMAAGVALWQHAPPGPALATVALILSTLAAVVTLGTSVLPSNIPPGEAPFWIAAITLHNGAWLFYLWRRRES